MFSSIDRSSWSRWTKAFLQISILTKKATEIAFIALTTVWMLCRSIISIYKLLRHLKKINKQRKPSKEAEKPTVFHIFPNVFFNPLSIEAFSELFWCCNIKDLSQLCRCVTCKPLCSLWQAYSWMIHDSIWLILK